MKERMEKQLLHTITLADNEIHWVKEGKEIWVGGKMFDIKSFEQTNGKTTFHGLYDEEETSLNKKFNEGREKKLPEQTQLLVQLFQSLQGICFSQANDIFFIPAKQNLIVSTTPPGLTSQFETIPTPPPQDRLQHY